MAQMTHTPAVSGNSDASLRQAAAVPTTPQCLLSIQLPGGTERYPVTSLEVTADPEAWFVELQTSDRLPADTYAAVLEQGAQHTPGAYTVVPHIRAEGDTAQQGLQGIFRPCR